MPRRIPSGHGIESIVISQLRQFITEYGPHGHDQALIIAHYVEFSENFDDKVDSWNAMGEMIHDTNTSPLPVYFGHENRLFGWLHFDKSVQSHSTVVICSPVGFEQVRTHATVRALSEVLAEEGHTVLRFDYPSTGDSLDLPDLSGHVDAWIESIKEAIQYVSDVAGSTTTALTGIRLGATLANLVAQEVNVHGLVLLEPSESGKLFCREMQILASATKAKRSGESIKRDIDSGGFVLTEATQKSLMRVVLGKKPVLGNAPILLLERDDIRAAERRINALEGLGSVVTRQHVSGYKQMMLAPQDSEVPTATLEIIKDWLGEHLDTNCSIERQPQDSATMSRSLPVTHASNGVSEQAIQFGSDGRLFGILTRSRSESGRIRPALITLCGGAVPHYSANRMYVPLARLLAARGIDVLRIDLSGIGDSDASPGGPRQVPYTLTITEDVTAAMAAVTAITGTKSFSLLGLCSGAFGAMQVALVSDQVTSVILVNQLVYFVPPAAYSKLAIGQIKAATDLDFPRFRTLPDRTVRRIIKSAGAAGSWMGNMLQNRLIGGPLARTLRTINRRDIDMVFIHSEDDPATDALMLPAQRTVRRLIKSNAASLILIPNSDHTFSPAAAQQALMDAVIRVFDRRNRS